MLIEKNSLAPRETVLRMLAHLREDASYEEIIRQVRILQDIENTLTEVGLGLNDQHQGEPAREGTAGTKPMPFRDRGHPPSSEGRFSPWREAEMRAETRSPQRRRQPELLLREAVWID